MEIEIYTDDHRDDTLLGYNEMYERYMLGDWDEEEECRVEKTPPLRYFPGRNCGQNHYILAVENDQVIGAICLRVGGKPSLDGHNKWLRYISVLPEHQGKGVATALIEKMFDHCSQKNIQGIHQSSYTEEGWERAMPVFTRVASRYPEVEFIDEKKKRFW